SHGSRVMTGERACSRAESAAAVRGGNTSASGTDLGRDHGTLGMRVRTDGARQILRLCQRSQVHLLAQVGELVLYAIELLLRLDRLRLLLDHRRGWWWWLRLLLDHDARQPLRHLGFALGQLRRRQ